MREKVPFYQVDNEKDIKLWDITNMCNESHEGYAEWYSGFVLFI